MLNHICPTCGNEVKPEQLEAKTDEQVFLEFWTPTLGAEEAQKSWEAKQKQPIRQASMVQSDIQGYISQVDGSWIDSKSKHREHLKQHRMIELGNDYLTEQKKHEVSKQSQEMRKRAIAEQIYSKIKY
jgi:hypothetical protein